MMRFMSRWVAVAAVVLTASSAAWVSAQPPVPPAKAATGDTGQPRIDPQALELFKKMCDYLGSAKAFRVRASFREEVMLLTGQKLVYDSWAQVSVRRPDRLRTSRHGILEDLEVYYDGKSVAMFRRQPNLYAVTPAPPTIGGMFDAMRSQFDISIPGSDLLYADAYAGMIEDVTDAFYVGLEDIGGLLAHHLGFRHPDVDWQVWIQEGEKPLPVKYIITTKWMTGAPSFDVAMTDWDLAPRLDDATFAFMPPPGAQKIEFKRPPDVPAAYR